MIPCAGGAGSGFRPDVRLAARFSAEIYGDHGGAGESVQRVPAVFWSPSLAPGDDRGQTFRTVDFMPTILRAMRITLTAPVDGQAHPLGHTED